MTNTKLEKEIIEKNAQIDEEFEFPKLDDDYYDFKERIAELSVVQENYLLSLRFSYDDSISSEQEFRDFVMNMTNQYIRKNEDSITDEDIDDILEVEYYLRLELAEKLDFEDRTGEGRLDFVKLFWIVFNSIGIFILITLLLPFILLTISIIIVELFPKLLILAFKRIGDSE